MPISNTVINSIVHSACNKLREKIETSRKRYNDRVTDILLTKIPQDVLEVFNDEKHPLQPYLCYQSVISLILPGPLYHQSAKLTKYVPMKVGNCWALTVDNTTQAEIGEITDLFKDYKLFQHESELFQKELRAIIKSFASLKLLAEAMPELVQFFPSPEKKSTNLPSNLEVFRKRVLEVTE